MQTQSQNQEKARGLLKLVNLFTGSSVIVKGIVTALALICGYGGAAFYKGKNQVSDIAQVIVEEETGVSVNFTQQQDISPAQICPKKISGSGF